VPYLNATINVKPEKQNRRLKPTGRAKPGETCRLTGTGPGLARQESACRVFGRVWNQTDRFFWSEPGPLMGYLDPLLTLPMLLEPELPILMNSVWISIQCRGVLMMGSLTFNSIVSPQWPPSVAPLCSFNGRFQVILRVCSTTICSQIDSMYIYRKT